MPKNYHNSLYWKAKYFERIHKSNTKFPYIQRTGHSHIVAHTLSVKAPLKGRGDASSYVPLPQEVASIWVTHSAHGHDELEKNIPPAFDPDKKLL